MKLNKFAYLYSKPLGNHTLKIMKKIPGNLVKKPGKKVGILILSIGHNIYKVLIFTSIVKQSVCLQNNREYVYQLNRFIILHINKKIKGTQYSSFFVKFGRYRLENIFRYNYFLISMYLTDLP